MFSGMTQWFVVLSMWLSMVGTQMMFATVLSLCDGVLGG